MYRDILLGTKAKTLLIERGSHIFVIRSAQCRSQQIQFPGPETALLVQEEAQGDGAGGNIESARLYRPGPAARCAHASS